MIQQQDYSQCHGERPSNFEHNGTCARLAPAQLALFRAITDPLPRPIPAPASLKNSMSAPVQRASSKNTLLETLHGSAEHAISWMVEENSTFQVPEHVAPQWVDVKPKRGFARAAFAKPNATDVGSPVITSGFGPPQRSLGDIATDHPSQPPPTTVTWELPPVLHQPDGTVCPTLPTLSAAPAVAWAVETKNTFLNVQVPQQLTLQRAATDPMHALLENPTQESQSPLFPVVSRQTNVTDDTSQPTTEVPQCGLGAFTHTDSNLPLKTDCLHASSSILQAVPANKVEQVVGRFSANTSPTLPEKCRQDPLQMHVSSAVAAPESESDGTSEQAPASASQPMFVSLPVVTQNAIWLPPPPSATAPVMEPMPPTQPPAMPAPIMDMPGAPRAPLVPPSHTPGASVVALLNTDLCTPGLIVRAGSACTHVHWAVDARKLERQDKQAVSPVFTVMLPGFGPAPFKIMLDAKVVRSHGKKAAGFLKVKGCGRVLLKCESQLPENCADIAFRIGVGRGDLLQPFRATVVRNFFEHSCHGLPTADEEWDFTASVDNHDTFLVTLEVAPKSALLADPNIWWCSFESENSAS